MVVIPEGMRALFALGKMIYFEEEQIMKRRAIGTFGAWITAAALCLSLTACGGAMSEVAEGAAAPDTAGSQAEADSASAADGQETAAVSGRGFHQGRNTSFPERNYGNQ